MAEYKSMKTTPTAASSFASDEEMLHDTFFADYLATPALKNNHLLKQWLSARQLARGIPARRGMTEV